MRCSRRPPSASERLRRLPACCGILWLLLAAGAPPPCAEAAAESAFAVVASQSVPADNLTLPELRRIFRLEKRFWKAGEPLVLLMPPPGSATRSFAVSRILRTTEADLRRLVLEKMYRGEIDLAPKVVASDAEAASFAASGRGVLALVPAGAAIGAGMKVLRIDGRLPRDAGYALIP